MFWVISASFNIRNTLPKSGTFLLITLYMCVCAFSGIRTETHVHVHVNVLLKLYK
jgi:hypothetical protein